MQKGAETAQYFCSVRAGFRGGCHCLLSPLDGLLEIAESPQAHIPILKIAAEALQPASSIMVAKRCCCHCSFSVLDGLLEVLQRSQSRMFAAEIDAQIVQSVCSLWILKWACRQRFLCPFDRLLQVLHGAEPRIFEMERIAEILQYTCPMRVFWRSCRSHLFTYLIPFSRSSSAPSCEYRSWRKLPMLLTMLNRLRSPCGVAASASSPASIAFSRSPIAPNLSYRP